MAAEQGGVPTVVLSFVVDADLSTKQFHMIEVAAGVPTVCNAVTDVVMGVLQNKPKAAGEVAELVVAGPTKVVAGGAITAPALFGTKTDGRAVALTIGSDTTQYIVGRVLETSADDGDIVSAIINCVALARAA